MLRFSHRLALWAFFLLGALSLAAAPRFAAPELTLRIPHGAPAAPYEVPILGVASTAEWQALRVTVTSPSLGSSLLNARIAADTRSLVFTPPPSGSNYESHDCEITVYDSRSGGGRSTLKLRLSRIELATPRSIRYHPVTGAPAVLRDNALVIYPDGRPSSALALCLPARPSDFVFNSNGTQAHVLLGPLGTVHTYDLASRRLIASCSLNGFLKEDPFVAWFDSPARLSLGRSGEIFVLQRSPIGPVRRHRLSDGALLQTLTAPAADLGWRDVALSADGGALWLIAKRSVYPSVNTLVYRSKLATAGAAESPALLADQPEPDTYSSEYERRVLPSADSLRLAAGFGFYRIETDGSLALEQSFSAPVLGFQPRAGLLMLRSGQVVDTATREPIARELPSYQEWSFKIGSLVFFDNTLLAQADFLRPAYANGYRKGSLAREFRPAADGPCLPTQELSWPRFPGSTLTQVRLEETARDGVELDVPTLVVETSTADTRVILAETLRAGSTYHWRLVPSGFSALRADDITELAADFSGVFTVNAAVPQSQTLALESVVGLTDGEAFLDILAASPGSAWSLRSNQPWLTPSLASGTGPARVRLRLDSTALAATQWGTSPHQAEITLSAGTLEHRVLVNLTLRNPSLASLLSHPARSRCYGIASGSWLIEFDAATGLRLRAVRIPEGKTLRLLHPDDDRIYFAEQKTAQIGLGGARYYEEVWGVSLDDLEFQPCGEVSWGGVWHYAGPGRIIKPSALYVQGTEAWELYETAHFNRTPGPLVWQNAAATAPDGRSLYRLTRNYSAATGTRFTVEHVSLVSPDFPLLATVELPTDLASSVYGLALVGGDRVRLLTSYGDRPQSYDLGLAPFPPETDLFPEPYADAASGTRRLASSLAYDLANPADVREVAASSRLKVFNPVAGRFLYEADGRHDLVSLTWEDLPPAKEIEAHAGVVGPFSVTLEALPAGEAGSLLPQVRLPGSDRWLTLGGWGASLTPSTAYEFRVRRITGNISTRWSPVITLTTAIAPPRWVPQNDLPANRVGLEGAAFSYLVPISGPDVEFELGALPPGLVWDPATRSIVGTPSASGDFSVTIRATNSSGTIEPTLAISIAAAASTRRTAFYSGLIDFTEAAGPTVGHWRITRTGDAITGTHYSALYTRSFRMTLAPGARLMMTGENYYLYRGVAVYVTVAWNRATDTLTLSGYTIDLEENVSFQSTDYTSQGAFWDAKTSPCPDAARYTALISSDPDIPDDSPTPQGMGLLTTNIAATGTVTFTTELPTGERFTQSTYLGGAGALPFFLYKNPHLTVGELFVTREITGSPRLVGEIGWARDSTSKGSSFYRDGFETSRLVIGAPLAPVGKNLPPLAPLANAQNRATLRLSEGGLSRLSKPIVQSLTPTDSTLVAPKAGFPANPNRVTVKLDAKTGHVTGSAAILDLATQTKTVRTLKYRAMLVQNPLGDGEDIIGGYFLLPDAAGRLQSGLVEIAEPSTEAP